MLLQILASRGILVFTFSRPESPGIRPGSWKDMQKCGKSWKNE